MKRMTTNIAVLAALIASPLAWADEMGSGKDGPNAAPTNPDETTEESTSFWDTLLETFDLVDDE